MKKKLLLSTGILSTGILSTGILSTAIQFTAILFTGTLALAGGAGPRPAAMTPAAMTYTCTDGTVITPNYLPASVLLTVKKGNTVQQYELEALRPYGYGDAEHTWVTKGKAAKFVTGAAGDHVLICTAK